MGFALVGVTGCMPQKQAVTALPAEYATFQFADEIAGLELHFHEENMDHSELEGGRRFFTASGIIANTSDEKVKMLPLMFAFKDKREKVIFLHEVALPHGDIQAHEVMKVDAYILDVPKESKHVEIGWKAGGEGAVGAAQAD